MHLKYFELYWLTQNKKQLCSHFMTIDSFNMFKNKEGIEWCKNKVAFEIPHFKLKATLQDNRYEVEYNAGSYAIPIDKQSCNYGGYRYFFHCPQCNKRMRILYCNDGKFLCRKCLNLGYFTQRLNPSTRWIIMASKTESKLKSMGGSLDRKPPWIKQKTFEALQEKYREYDELKPEKAFFKSFLKEELRIQKIHVKSSIKT